MSLARLRDEFAERGWLTESAVKELRHLLRGSDPYSAITLVGDAKERRLAGDVAALLQAGDSMVRWNAANVLFTRLKDPTYFDQCLAMAQQDARLHVRAVALCGLGEVLPSLEISALRKRAASTLVKTLESVDEELGLREAAYEGILAGLGVPPPKRPPASRHLDLTEDVDPEMVRRFKGQYLHDA